jgi:hypothetical protein
MVNSINGENSVAAGENKDKLVLHVFAEDLATNITPYAYSHNIVERYERSYATSLCS